MPSLHPFVFVNSYNNNNNNNNNNKCKEIGVQLDKKQWYEHAPKSVVTNQGEKVTILWNQNYPQ